MPRWVFLKHTHTHKSLLLNSLCFSCLEKVLFYQSPTHTHTHTHPSVSTLHRYTHTHTPPHQSLHCTATHTHTPVSLSTASLATATNGHLLDYLFPVQNILPVFLPPCHTPPHTHTHTR